MSGESILIIEDDPSMLRGLKDNFEFSGYRVKTSSNGEDGLNDSLNLNPDLIILDLMLPGVNGYEICRAVRQKGLEMPIIMLTAKSEESDIVLGLNLGADDYVTKPFSIKELLARTDSLLRRSRKDESTKYTFGDFQLDIEFRKLRKKDREIELTPKEFELLTFFLKRLNRALTRDQILDAVWGLDNFVTPRSVDRCINSLRKKIEKKPHQPDFIKTVHKIGYRFELEEKENIPPDCYQA
jgi:DNA-binding response OmpR family regulator